MVFLDESGYLLQPLRRRVWAPQGETPLQYAWDRHDRITAIAALARAPWAARLGLYFTFLDHNARTSDFVEFFQVLHAKLRRPITLVCDRLPAHRSAVRRLLAAGATWLTIEWLPPYAPELDPVENVWNQSKGVDLANVTPQDIDDLRRQLTRVLDTYRQEPNRLHTFFATAHLSV